MPPTITHFDTSKHHIHINFFVTDSDGIRERLGGIIDTGAPKTEFNDDFLPYGFIKPADNEISIKPGLQTQKYGKIVLPSMEICGQTIENFEVMISRFEESWGIAALIGLDFFRRFRITIDYSKGILITEPH